MTGEEFALLKSRAEESGLSVSAYMRSCVLEAESLRVQVKQAMAEMRALGTLSALSHATALAPHSAEAPHRRAWFRVLFRSVAVLLNPLFPMRRSA
jgi:hypothetical protein